MEIFKLENKRVRCDMGGCKNNAKYAVSALEGRNKTYLCEQCARELHDALGKEFVPESVKNMFLKKENAKK